MSTQKKSGGGSIFIVILLVGLFIWCISHCDLSSSGDSSTVRCYYCSKVIRSGGVNIHCTQSGKTLICDYCGHSTVM